MPFSKGISPKEDLIARLEIELVYNDLSVQHVGHFTRETPSVVLDRNI